jgi:multiple sugar transport system permease protein
MVERAKPWPLSGRSRGLGARVRSALGADWRVGFMFIAPIVILLVLFIAWPFIRAMYISLTARSIGRQTRFVGLENYTRLWSDPFFRRAVRNTFVFTGSAIFFKFLAGLCAALLLNAQQRWRDFFTGLVLLPWIIPSVVQALSWRSIYDPLFGGLNPILLWLGILKEPVSWLADYRLALPCVVVVNVWAGIPFFTANLLAGLQSVDRELYEAAEVDGANAWDRFVHITLPSLRYVIVVTTLLSTIWTFNNFETIFLLTGGGPGGATRVYAIYAYEMAIRGLRFGPGTAAAFSLTPLLAFFILLLSRYMRRDIAESELETTWQDRIIDAIGWLFGWIGRIISFPVSLVARGIGSLARTRASKSRPSSLAQSQQRGAIGRGIALALLLLLIFFPFYWIVITAFKTDLQIGQRLSIFWPQPWSLAQFRRLFYDEPFFQWLRNSLIVSISTTVLAVLFSSLGAYALARLRFFGAQAMTTVLLITYLLPGALMFIPLYKILTDLRLINSLAALIATYPTFMMPFATWLLMGYYRSIPEDLELAAMVDGATRLQAFVKVTLPLTAPALLAVTLFSFTSAWKEFLFAFVFITNERLMTLPVGLAQTIYGDIYPWGLLMAASLLISIPVVIFYMWGQRFMIAGLTAGSIKG